VDIDLRCSILLSSGSGNSTPPKFWEMIKLQF